MKQATCPACGLNTLLVADDDERDYYCWLHHSAREQLEAERRAKAERSIEKHRSGEEFRKGGIRK